jgi:hypothetical protein
VPSQLHEALVFLFRSKPALAPELLSTALHVGLPQYTEVRVDSAELTDVQPAEYRADVVVLLRALEPVLGIVIEVQLSRDERKRFVWPAYVASLRRRIECAVLLLVVTPDETVARWAAMPIDLGGGNIFVPCVLRPAAVPEVVEPEQAKLEPELAVLSAMAHGRDVDAAKAARIAFAAQTASSGLDDDRSRLYFDLVSSSLSEAARRELQAMDFAKYEYQSDFAKRYVAQGRAEGRAEVIIRQLTLRYGELPPAVQSQIAEASLAELDAIAERLLTAPTLQEALGS